MIKIKSKKEFNDYVANYPSLPLGTCNLVEYNGGIHIVWAGTSYLKSSYDYSFTEDFFHKGFFIPINNDNHKIIYTKINLALPPLETVFSKRHDETWIFHENSKTSLTLNTEKVKELNSFYLWEVRRICYTSLTNSELEDIGFIRGEVNTEIWFHNYEIEQLDGHMPYRKFNNIYKIVNIKQIVEENKLRGLSEKEAARELKLHQDNNVKFGVTSPTFIGLEGITNTYGVELESIAGRLEEGEEENLNLRTVHDGSLRIDGGEPEGAEYVTGVLIGDTGLNQLFNICKVLGKRCKLNQQCGVHVHVGGLEWSKEDVVYSYILAEAIEEELFSTLPKSRRNNEYCRPLSKLVSKTRLQELRNAKDRTSYNIVIDDIYDDILNEVTYPTTQKKLKDQFISSKQHNRNQQHPAGAKCGYNKAYQRYCWLNYITLLYNTKGGANSHTLEFRCHSGTFNYVKVSNWLKICLAFCKYVEKQKSKILNEIVTLEMIIHTIYPKTGSSLVKYIKERKEVFKTHGESIDYKDEVPANKTIKEVACAY